MISRRNFLSNSALSLLASLIGMPALGTNSANSRVWKNWSGGQECHPQNILVPDDEQALIKALKELSASKGKIRPVGFGHSFSPLVPTDETLISLSRLSGLIDSDSDSNQATIWAGTRMSAMGEPLSKEGQALMNMADIDRQSLAGAIATSTHGTGMSLGSLSSYITHLSLVTQDGILIECSENQSREIFQAAKVSLGSLGLITRIGMQNRETYRLKKTTWGETTNTVLERAEELSKKHRHFEMFPMVNSDMAIVQTIDETSEELTPIPGPDAEGDETLRTLQEFGGYLPWLRRWLTNSAVEEMHAVSVVGNSWEILANIRNLKFNEMEYQVPRESGPDCLREILSTIEANDVDIVFPLEYRYVHSDDAWLSMFHEKESCSISVHHFSDYDYKPYFDLVEPIFWKYGGRPHWGKIHSLSARELKPLYPRWDDFLSIRKRLDPNDRLMNDHLKKIFNSG